MIPAIATIALLIVIITSLCQIVAGVVELVYGLALMAAGGALYMLSFLVEPFRGDEA